MVKCGACEQSAGEHPIKVELDIPGMEGPPMTIKVCPKCASRFLFLAKQRAAMERFEKELELEGAKP